MSLREKTNVNGWSINLLHVLADGMVTLGSSTACVRQATMLAL